MSHTPGPWKLFMNDGIIAIMTEDRKEVVHWSGFDSSDYPKAASANARLIAATPELLEALRGIIEIGKRDMSDPKYDGYFESARKAIAEAEGKEQKIIPKSY